MINRSSLTCKTAPKSPKYKLWIYLSITTSQPSGRLALGANAPKLTGYEYTIAQSQGYT